MCIVLKENGDDIVDMSLGTFKGCGPSFDPDCAYLETYLGKIMWITFFDPS